MATLALSIPPAHLGSGLMIRQGSTVIGHLSKKMVGHLSKGTVGHLSNEKIIHLDKDKIGHVADAVERFLRYTGIK